MTTLFSNIIYFLVATDCIIWYWAFSHHILCIHTLRSTIYQYQFLFKNVMLSKHIEIGVLLWGAVYLYIFNTNFVEYNRHFLSTYFLVDPFILPYWFYGIRQELIDIFFIVVCFPITFCPTLGHHQERMYYKSDVTFVCTLLLCKKKSIWGIALYRVYF